MLSENAPLTVRQEELFPLLKECGGLVISRKYDFSDHPYGRRIPPTKIGTLGRPRLPK